MTSGGPATVARPDANRPGADDDTTPEPEAGWAYRPHLDGLRAVAVYLVVAFHAGAARAAGGFIGVDVFFVLSGYLVTGVLVRRVAARGRVGLTGFYARRARRLLPAALVNLVVTGAVMSAIAAPAELESIRESITAAALYVSNWWFIAEDAAYFGSDVTASPVLHYWSLSIEEQFYLLWPLALTALFAVARRGRSSASRRAVQVVVALGAAASLGWALVLAGENPTRSYYGTDARAYQLLAGAFLALSPGLLRRIGVTRRAGPALPFIALGALLGLLLLATNLLDVEPVHRGAMTAVLSVALLVSLEAAPGGAGRWLLSRPSLVWLGRMSYGTYLWHWLVVVVLTREADVSPLTTFFVAASVATGLAAISHQLLETPIRTTPRLDRVPGPVVATALAMSLLVGLVVAPRLLDSTAAAGTGSGTAAAQAAPVSGTPVTVDWQAAIDDIYDDELCGQGGDVVCHAREGGGRRTLLVGDSHGAMITPMMISLAEDHDLDLWYVNLPYCPWVRDVKAQVFSGDCWEHQTVLYDETIPELDPDLVFLIHQTVDDPLATTTLVARGYGPIAGDSPEAAEALEAGMRRVIGDLRDDGRDVVILEPVPAAPFLVADCLSEARVLEECRFVASRSPTPEEAAMRRMAERDGVWSVDLDGAVCPYLPICDPVVDGRVVYKDGSHLTVDYARQLQGPLEEVLVEAGVLESPS